MASSWAALFLLGVLGAQGQTLAHKNWAGSGLSPQSWWSRGVFCRVELRPANGAVVTLKTVRARVEALEAVGCDALELGSVGVAGMPVDAGFGTVDDANDLIDEVARRKMRVVLEMPVSGALTPAGEQELTGRVRFWLTRGVAGIVLRGDATAADTVGLARRLRQVVSGSLGTRVLIGDGVEGTASGQEVQLVVRQVDGPLKAGQTGAVRSRLVSADGGLGARLPVVAAADTSAAAKRVRGAMLLLRGDAALVASEPFASRGAGVVDTGGAHREFSAEELRLWIPAGEYAAQEDTTTTERDKAMVEWFRALTELHHANATLRSGQVTYLNHDGQDVLVWVLRAKGAGAPLLVACNLSGKALRVAVGADLKSLGVRQNYLRTLLRSEPDQPYAATIEAIDLAADGVFVGELR